MSFENGNALRQPFGKTERIGPRIYVHIVSALRQCIGKRPERQPSFIEEEPKGYDHKH
jgi:hypothetical protein